MAGEFRVATASFTDVHPWSTRTQSRQQLSWFHSVLGPKPSSTRTPPHHSVSFWVSVPATGRSRGPGIQGRPSQSHQASCSLGTALVQSPPTGKELKLQAFSTLAPLTSVLAAWTEGCCDLARSPRNSSGRSIPKSNLVPFSLWAAFYQAHPPQ